MGVVGAINAPVQKVNSFVCATSGGQGGSQSKPKAKG